MSPSRSLRKIPGNRFVRNVVRRLGAAGGGEGGAGSSVDQEVAIAHAGMKLQRPLEILELYRSP